VVIWTIAKTTVGEAMRKKVLIVCLIVAVAMMVISLSFSQLGFKQDMTIVKSLGLFVILLAGFIISVLMSISLIPNEMERRTIYTILSKPVKRYEFVVGKFLGGLMTVFITTMVMGAVLIAMVAIKAKFGSIEVSVQGAGDLVKGASALKPQLVDTSLILGIILIYFQFFLLYAIVMFFSVFMTPTVNFFASASVYILGSGAGVWKAMSSNEQTPMLVRKLYSVIYTVIPNFDYFNVQNKLIHPHVEVRSFPVYVAGVICYALVYSVVVMIVSVLLFEKKEV
jgi:ABC-type transport system involved in multi-copper enzyme maturation permease subunit